jgi:bifunctional non-homologous end joining protein LigD
MARPRTSAARSKEAPVDKQLERYRSMRHFDVTAEPAGSSKPPQAAKDALPFVIQKHAASHLHYDFRLGWNGVLKSWAVAKGPSYFPGDKRLAVQVEDHPMEYGGFEGIIPKGQYGGGTVMLWDRGTWEPHGDAEEGLRKGSLKFSMNGEKMRGKWALIRMAPRPNDRSGKPNWLLIKEHDEFEQPQDAPSVEESAPLSVLTGRDIEGIAHDQDRVWNSNREEKKGPVLVPNRKTRAVAPPELLDWSNLIKHGPKEKLPDFIAPQLATLAKAPPAGDRWVHEIKLDGYRIQVRIEKGRVQLLTRNGLDWTHRMTALAEAASQFPVKSAIVDGEVVVLSPDGTSSFASLQAAFQEGSKHHLTYFAFDLLHLDGHNLRDLPLIERKKILHSILAQSATQEDIRLSEHLTGDAEHVFQKACELGTEGIVSKLADGRYINGRGSSWVKIKCYQEQELVIGGFTLPTNGIHGVGALVLGYYRGGKLIYAGRTGTGFTQKIHKMLRDKLEKLRTAKIPFAEIPRDAVRGSIWVKPELVAQVSFSTWTADNLVRQAAFKGLREDKPAKKVVREMPQDATTAAATAVANEKRSSRETAPRKAAKAAAGSTLPIRLTHPEKVLDAETGITKEQLARYYMEVAPFMLPHIANRPLTLVRCVDGSGKPCFYQKHTNKMLTGGFKAVAVRNKKTGVDEPYITLDSEHAIVQLAQVGVLEVHPWGSHNETLEQPDRIVIDLDPDAAIEWHTLTESAKEVRKRLKALGLKSWIKTTGGKGLHVVFPIRPEHEWPEVKQWTHDFVNAMARDYPRRFLTKMSKAARVGKIFLDYLRNDRNATAVAPFSPRARAGLPVAVPLSWTELDSDQPPRFQVASIERWRKRLARDPWKDMEGTDQRLPL